MLGIHQKKKDTRDRKKLTIIRLAIAIRGLPSKEIASWFWLLLSAKDQHSNAFDLMRKLRAATSPQEFQLTTDGFGSYLSAVDEMLGDRVHFAQLVKTYARPQENERRYSPPEMICAVPNRVSGNPNPELICTSHIERFNRLCGWLFDA